LGDLSGSLQLAGVDVLDLDEERYRKGEWAVRLVCSAPHPHDNAIKTLISIMVWLHRFWHRHCGPLYSMAG
jgi:hypothetical protein